MSHVNGGTVKLSLQFTLSGTAASSAGATARAWIDINKSGQLTQDEELDLTLDGTTWSGTIKSDQEDSGDMSFIVKYIAVPGADWSIEVKSDTPSDHIVFSDHGKVPSLQAHVIGALDA